MKKFYLPVFLTLFTSAAFAQVYVTPTGAGAKNGTSWSDAYDNTQLQTAINGAASGTQVWVAKGTYKPTESLSINGKLADEVTAVTDRDKTFILKAGVEIYGGFAGGETFGPAAIVARNLVLNETILSGDLNGSNVADIGDAYHVVSSRNASLAAVLDGFTVQHGFADGTGSVAVGGGEVINQNIAGGIYITGVQSGATFRNLIVKSNESKAYAAGVFAQGADGFNFISVRFENNIGAGGGAGLLTSATTPATFNVTDCTFMNNKGALEGGGGLHHTGNPASIINITNCMFANNESTLSGGAFRLSVGTANITGTTFKNSKTTLGGGKGGAIYSAVGSTLNVDGSTFKDNASASGAHYYLDGGTGNFTNTTFENGAATGSGGAIYQIGTAGVLNLTNCLFNANTAAQGGHYFISSGAGTIKNTTFQNATTTSNAGAIFSSSNVTLLDIISSKFYSNTANGTGGGGAIYSSGNLKLTKTEFRSNTAVANGGALYLTSSANVGGVDVKINNSLFYNNTANGVGTAGNGGGAILHTRYISGANKTNCVLTAINNTFYANKSPGSPHGAIAFNSVPEVIINLYNNIFNANSGDGTVPATNFGDVRRLNTATQNYVNNIFQGDITSSGARTVSKVFLLNSVTPEPLFASTTEADPNFLRLVEGIATESGDNTLATNGGVLPGTDLDGQPRMTHTDIDLGAYEFQGVLPVIISSFTAKLANNRTQLKWSVGTENNVNRYEVERSQNGVDFAKVAEVTASKANVYSTIDAAPEVGVNYYRLKTVDNDGTHSYYGSIQSVKVATLTSKGVKVYPNPLKGNKVSVAMSSSPVGTYTYKLVSTAGATLEKGSVNYDGVNDVRFTTNVSAGIYLLYLENGAVKMQTKLIKQ